MTGIAKRFQERVNPLAELRESMFSHPEHALALGALGIATCLGAGRAATLAALRTGSSGLHPCTFDSFPFSACVGEIPELDTRPLEGRLAGFDCRNNRAARLALQADGFTDTIRAARERYGPARIGVFVGTSTSGLLQTEIAYRHRDAATGRLPPEFDYARTHNSYSLARFVRTLLCLSGPAFVVSTACAATAKAFGAAARMIRAGVCDAAVVGGADTLCATTLFGFHALGLMAEEPCRPFDAGRRGISIGEGAGFVLLERATEAPDRDTILLLGVGESSDAYHMSAPHPDGIGARLAMQRALASAGLEPAAIDYVHLHGTATTLGDAAEDRAVFALFGSATPCSSTKGFTGHPLGTSGVIGAIFCALGLGDSFLPGSPHTRTVDPAFKVSYVREGRPARLERVMTNSFGFGGANCSLVLGRAG